MASYHLQLLKFEYDRRRSSNKGYSLAAYARDLGVHKSILSRTLSEKTSLGVKTARIISKNLGLNKTTNQKFMESTVKHALNAGEQYENVERSEISQDQFAVIEHWYHFAILELTFTEDFSPDPKYIARSLGITALDARYAIDRLLRLGLLKRENNTLVKTSKSLTTSNRNKTSNALKNYTDEILSKAKHANRNHKLTDRSMFNMTMAIDPKDLPLAKRMIEEFTNKLCESLESRGQKRVYHFQAGLFSLQKEPSE